MYIYKEDLILNNQQWLIFPKTHHCQHLEVDVNID